MRQRRLIPLVETLQERIVCAPESSVLGVLDHSLLGLLDQPLRRVLDQLLRRVLD